MVDNRYLFVNKLKSQLRLSNNRVAHLLSISPRTLYRRKLEGHLLEKEAIKIHALISLFEQAEYFFNDSEQAILWLNKPAKAFRYQVPFDLMNTEQGVKAIRILLTQLEYGIYP